MRGEEATDPATTEADAARLARQLAEVAASERELRALLAQAQEQIAERDRLLDEMTAATAPLPGRPTASENRGRTGD